MSARDEIAHVLLMAGLMPDDWLDAHRAEVLREAIDHLDERIIAMRAEPRFLEGQGDTRGPGLCDAVGVLRRMADDAGKDTRGGSQPTAGESTRTAGLPPYHRDEDRAAAEPLLRHAIDRLNDRRREGS